MDSSLASSGMEESGGKEMLKRTEACHQCRKRKVKCDAQRPCSNCRRTHHKMLRINPHLGHIEPNCTYGNTAASLVETEGAISLESLNRLEERVEELEKLLNPKAQPPKVNLPGRYVSTYNPGVGTQRQDLMVNLVDDFVPPKPPRLPMILEEWPPRLPPRTLTLHLIDLFFTCYPNSRRIIHRPTFLLQLLEHPSSPRFPFVPLLHAICTATAMHSPFVSVAPIPEMRNDPLDDVFREKTRVQQGRDLAFDEYHFLISKYECMAAAREGRDLIGVIQACIINSWWAFAGARWFDLWTNNSLAMRMCIALGLNLSDSLQNPLPSKARERLLIGAPTSHTDVELRRNLFWLTYSIERYHLSPNTWALDVCDEDIHQTLPGTLEAFESGYDDGQERQNMFSADLFSTHRINQDDFGLYVKCAILLSRIHSTQYRQLARLETAEQVQNSQELKILETFVSSMRTSINKMHLSPIEQSSTSAISNIYMGHTVPLWAMMKIHIDLAKWGDPTCESANKSLSAARSMIRYITGLASTSWDFKRLDRAASMGWSIAARVLLYSLKNAPESLAPILRAEVRLVRNTFLIAGDRVVLYLSQRRWLDQDAVQCLGEREAAKLFVEDEPWQCDLVTSVHI